MTTRQYFHCINYIIPISKTKFHYVLAFRFLNNPNGFVELVRIPISCGFSFFIDPRENVSVVFVNSQIICSSVQVFTVQLIYESDLFARWPWKATSRTLFFICDRFDGPQSRRRPLRRGEHVAALRITRAIANGRQILFEFDVPDGHQAGCLVRFDEPRAFAVRRTLRRSPASRYLMQFISFNRICHRIQIFAKLGLTQIRTLSLASCGWRVKLN